MPINAPQKVGILIPTCNRVSFLKFSLDSALKQSHGNAAIFVMDNGSGYATPEYMAAVADPRVTYVKNATDLGLIGSINKGIRLMPEEVGWCTILGDDDLLDARYIERSLEAASSSGAKAVVDSHRIFIDAEGNRMREAAPAPPEESAVGYLRNRVTGTRETYLTGVFFHRRAFEEIGGYPDFRTGIASDDAFIFALSLKDRLVHQEKARAFVRIHAGAESQACSRMPDIVKTLDQFRAYMGKAAGESGRFGDAEAEEYRKLVDRYAIIIGSTCWIQGIQGVIDRKEAGWKDDVKFLSDLAASDDRYFTSRIRFDAGMVRHLHFCPETLGVYRRLWKGLIRTYKFAVNVFPHAARSRRKTA
jgi:glycosyltransferase involved in cell wall biosynthesis